MDEIELLPLHSHPQFLVECEQLLNSEWPQALAARRRMLTQSSNTLPCSLVLVANNAKTPVVLGHSRIGRVLGQPDAFWVKSVVIQPEHRGKGFGKRLMLKTEEFAKNLGYSCSYLTTFDRQGFYQRIGYEYCQPVCFVGHSSFADKFMLKLGDQSTGLCETTDYLVNTKENGNTIKTKRSPMPSSSSSSAPPPPPLPPPLSSTTNSITEGENPESLQRKTWMRKSLA